MAPTASNSDFLLAIVHDFLSRKDRNLASVFKSKCSSVSEHITIQTFGAVDTRGLQLMKVQLALSIQFIT